MTENMKPYIDGLSVSGTLAAFIGALPAATAVLTFIWTLIRLYETRTIQRLLAWLREKVKRHGR